tara:strand:- start:3 stop:929 length:927 start_codon:yes stop_codon:yes gene_type:complete
MFTRNYWNPNHPILINNKEFRKQIEEPYIIIDGGAAGDIEEPFSHIKDISKFVRFEPRGSETVIMTEDIYVDGGLWKEDNVKKLHVAKRRTTSSLYPPNKQFLDNFDNRYGLPPRTTEFKLDINLRSIDSAVKNKEIPKPNFIKLDIHSAEFEAIQGSINSLDENLGFLVETWHSDVHKGQHLHGEIESFLVSKGYEVFDLRPAAEWKYKYKEKVAMFDKPRYIGSEMLFFRKNIPDHLMLKFIGLCDLFNFSNLAICAIEKSKNQKIKNLLTIYELLLKRKKKFWRWKKFGFLSEIKMEIKKILFNK